MLSNFKDKVVNKGMSLMQSPAIGKLMESEKFGAVVERAMAVPFKVSNAVTTQKERLVALFDLATQQDLDDIRRGMSRMEGVLKDIKRDSKDLLEKVSDNPKKG